MCGRSDNSTVQLYVRVFPRARANASGKARTEVYYNHLCTWVYFMLDKAHSALAVYSVNTVCPRGALLGDADGCVADRCAG